MNVTRVFTRGSLIAALLALAACQTQPLRQDAATEPSEATAATRATEAPSGPSMQEATGQGAPVAVFLADMAMQENWRPVQISADSTLYLNPQPVVTRDDLTGVQAGTNQQGQGLLALMLSDEGRRKLQDLTTNNPNKRLALVVGSTLMAAPTYSAPVTTGQLIFPVGTEQNAIAAARAIAGVEAGGSPASNGAAAGGAGASSSGTGLRPQ